MMDYLTRLELWLQSKGVTVWGTWNVQDPVQRKAAAAWFLNQQEEFDRWDNEIGMVTTTSWDVVQ